MAENIMLRKQLIIVSRHRRRSPNLSFGDRLHFAFLTALFYPSRIAKLAIIIKPSMLIKFHKALVKRKYRTLFSCHSRQKSCPDGPSQELINTIVEMKKRNPRFGCCRIAMQISTMFGIDVDKNVVWRVLSKHYHPTSNNDGPSWLALAGHMKDSLWSVDLFRCESILLKTHWVMVLMDQFTRRIIGFSVYSGDLNGTAICTMFNGVISKHSLPEYLSSDNDPLFRYQQWKANLRVLEIKELKTVPHVPISHPFVERLIRTCRNELIDQSLFWNKLDLMRKLAMYQRYYNESRTHMGLNGGTPKQVAINDNYDPIDINNYQWKSCCRSLFKLPIAA